MDSSDIEDRDDQRSGVPEYLQTKTAGLELDKNALGRIFRVKGDSECGGNRGYAYRNIPVSTTYLQGSKVQSPKKPQMHVQQTVDLMTRMRPAQNQCILTPQLLKPTCN